MRFLHFTLLACALPLSMGAYPAAAQTTLGQPELERSVPPGDLYPANREVIGANGETIKIATVPGKFQVRFTVDENDQVLSSVVIDSTTWRVVGVSAESSQGSESRQVVRPSNTGPPANFTGIWLLAEFPGGGLMYGEYASGVRTGTIIVQPDGGVEYFPR